MHKHDKLLSKRLQSEMKTVVFSEYHKANLSRHLKEKMAHKPSKQSILQKLSGFWNGTTEIPLTTGVIATAVVAVAVWGTIADLLLIDQSTAFLLLQTGKETVNTIEHGVSLL